MYRIITNHKMWSWFIFLASILVAYAIYQFIQYEAIKQETPYQNLSSSVKANEAYKKALDLCGSAGIFSIEWQDFNKGKLKDLYCNSEF